jgi:hypothetical protein
MDVAAMVGDANLDQVAHLHDEVQTPCLVSAEFRRRSHRRTDRLVSMAEPASEFSAAVVMIPFCCVASSTLRALHICPVPEHPAIN